MRRDEDDVLEVDAEVLTSSTESSSTSEDTSSSSDFTDSFTVLTVGGHHQVMPAGGITYLGPGQDYVQIGSGKCVVVGPSTSHAGRRRVKERTRHHDDRHQKPQTTQSTAVPSRSELNKVCSDIGRHWKKLARELGLSSGDTDRVEMDYSVEGGYEMAWQALQVWVRRHGDGAEKRILARALCAIGRIDVARHLT